MTILITEGIRGLVPALEQAKNGLPAIVRTCNGQSDLFAPKEWVDRNQDSLKGLDGYLRFHTRIKGVVDHAGPVQIQIYMEPEELAGIIENFE
jgi:hypothetical protein